MTGLADTVPTLPRQPRFGRADDRGRAVRRVAGFEWRLMRAERLFLPLALFFGLAIAYAANNGRSWAKFQRAAATEASREERTRLDALALSLDSLRGDTSALRPFGDPRNPYAAAQSRARRYAILPVAPLASLAVGQSDLFPGYYRVSMTSRETFLANDEVENPTNLLAGRFDLAFFIVFILPLFIIAITYNMLSAEREGGTLALVGSQPVTLQNILRGKLMTRGAVAIGAAALSVLLGAVLSGADLGVISSLGGLAAWLVVACVYSLFWLAVALLVNVLGRSSATNALALLVVWLVLAVMIPAMLATTVGILHPTPSRVEFVNATRDASNTAATRGAQLLAMYYQDHPELMAGQAPNMNDFAARSLAVGEEVARITRPIVERFDTALVRQQRVVDRWRFVSPAVAAHDVLVRLAGTDGDRYREFQRQADAYVGAIKGYIAPLMVQRTYFTKTHLAQMPEFAFDQAAARARSGAAVRAFAAVAGMLLGALILAGCSAVFLRRVSFGER